jgi:hypothetical protein
MVQVSGTRRPIAMFVGGAVRDDNVRQFPITTPAR